MVDINRRGITKVELVSVLIIIAVFIAVMIPLGYNFVEGQRRAQDRIKASNAQDTARQEYMLSHMGADPIIYSFSGKTEVLLVIAHAPVEGVTDGDYSGLTPPRKDYFNDGGNRSSTTLMPEARSDKIGDTPLYVVIGDSGEILYNSWYEALK